MTVLVDTSAWVDYFRSGKNQCKLEYLIDENLIITNDLILAELTPFLKVKNRQKLIKLLHALSKLALDINWNQIVDYQYKCLMNGLGVGIPDLIIAQNAKQNNCEIYTLDKHFLLMSDIIGFKII